MDTSHRPIIRTIIVCTAVLVAAIVWPRVFPRYVDAPGGALDRWTGATCSSLLSQLVRERDRSAPELCLFSDPKRRSIKRDAGQVRWR